MGGGVTKEWVQGKTREELDSLLLEADRVIRLREAGKYLLHSIHWSICYVELQRQ